MRDDEETAVGGARLRHDLTRFERFRHRHQQRARVQQVGGDERRRRTGGHRLDAARLQSGDDLVFLLDDEQRHPGARQRLADPVADAAVADEDGMPLLARHLDLGGGGLGAGIHRLVGRDRVCHRLGAVTLVEPRPQPIERHEQQRIEHDGDDGAGEHQLAAELRHEAERHAEAGQDERELADLRQADGDGGGGAERAPEQLHDGERGDRLGDDDDGDRRQHQQRIADEDRRVEQHADRDEEQHGEGVAQRQRLRRRLLAERGFAQDHAGEEGAEGKRHVEQLRGAIGASQRDAQHGEAEQLARAAVRNVVQDPGDHAPPDDEHDDDEGGHLGDGHAQRGGDLR